MPIINYICFSDLHFGDVNSLLTRLKQDSNDTDPGKPSDVMVQLVECLKVLINDNGGVKPILVLNGDILEMALNTDNEGIMVFQRFMELTMQKGKELFNDEKIIFIPGNHDHHLWESARETQYLKYIKGHSGILNIPWHVTYMFDKGDPKKIVESQLLTQLAQQYADKIVVATAYPNYAIMREDEQKCIIFHHGHLIEQIYRIMSTLKTWIFPEREKPRQVWHIEQENFAWIDFFWSTLGRSGEVGQDVGLIYHKLQSEEQVKELVYNVVNGIDKDYNLPGIDSIAAASLKLILGIIVKKLIDLEKFKTGMSPADSIEKNLKAYMTGPLREQIRVELGRENIPDVTFVFGHTHKPYQKDIEDIKGYNKWVNIYNTGGWVVDKVKPDPDHGGAIVLIDDDLNTVSLQMYKEKDYTAKAEDYAHKFEQANPLHQQIQGLVRPDEDPWKTFSRCAKEGVEIRAEHLKKYIGVTH